MKRKDCIFQEKDKNACQKYAMQQEKMTNILDLDFLLVFQKSTTHGVTQRTTGSCFFLDTMNTGNCIPASH